MDRGWEHIEYMTAIWRKDQAGWGLLSPAAFPDEARLHSLIEEAPQLLPLAGTPSLTILGREVSLASGTADLIAVESSGRVAVIEIKLAKNAEARRAVIAQVLTYAACLQGLTPDAFARDVLGSHLAKIGHSSIHSAIESGDQEGAFDAARFDEGLATSLREGRFRLVLVLDEAPAELIRLVGYLASIADKVLIDLITVSSFSIGGQEIIVPQRVDPEEQTIEPSPFSPSNAERTRAIEGYEDFATAVRESPANIQPHAQRRLDWAVSLQALPAVKLQTYHGKNKIITLLPRLRADDAGLVSVFKDDNGSGLWFWRSVFERRAPKTLASVEQALGAPLRKGNSTRQVSDELLRCLTAAYEEAALGRITAGP